MTEKENGLAIRFPRWAYDSAFGQNLAAIAADHGMSVGFFDTAEAHSNADYFGPAFQYKHAAIWRYFHSEHRRYLSGGNNVLFVDDGLVEPGKTVFVDRFGFGGASSIVLSGENCREISPDEQMEVDAAFEPLYGLFKGKNKGGPIVVALYMDLAAIHACHEMLPASVPVIFLRPPSLKPKFRRTLELYLKKHSNWSIYEGDQQEEQIFNARAVVTNLDRPAFLAIVRGIPIATLGRGLWSGARCTLDCGNKPRLLRTILAYDFDHEAAYSYLNAILRSQVSINASKADLQENINIAAWTERFEKKMNPISLV